MKQLTSATFKEFTKDDPIFIGKFVENFLRREDSKTEPDKKAGDLMGYKFTDEDGNEEIIGSSSTVKQVMQPDDKDKEPVKAGEIIGFEFLGKGITSKKRPFNKFNIYLFDSFEEAKKHFGIE
jgi:hypothetical protein